MNQVVVSVLNPKFKKLEQPLKKVVRVLFKAFPQIKNHRVEIYLVGKEVMDKNVLAFPAPQEFPRPDVKKGVKALGEIYLNPDHIRKEKLEIRKYLPAGRQVKLEIASQKLAYMLIHGFLHLFGYDHKKKSDTIIMQKKEQELLNRL